MIDSDAQTAVAPSGPSAQENVKPVVVKTVDLTKIYGEKRAVDRLTLELRRGDLFGFIGPNGSGKTTTMRMLATLLQPTWGEAYVCDCSIYTQPKEIRRLIGYMPDFFGVYDDMKVIEYLEFFASAYRIHGPRRRKVCEEMLELVDLSYKRDAFVTSLSRGMTQRLGLARVLLHDPQVLILDEPASGLDPRARIEIRALLKRLREMDKTIMVSSHILPELADICNKVGMIELGKLVVSADVQEVLRRVRERIILWIGVRDDVDGAARSLEGHPAVESLSIRDGRLRVALKSNDADYSELAEILVQAGFRLTLFREEEINLETAFMVLTRGITA
ncbi:MAG: ABC transporter ATP-binding protein [Thermogutta sp.]|nr:ABC transporter ATP-binding protein [Thermogutta sp.]